MKRVVCLLVFVSIACAGCEHKTPNQLTVERVRRGWMGEWETNSELRENIAKLESQRVVSRENFAELESELSEYKSVHEQNETLLVKIDELETTIESQGVVERIDKALLVRIAKLEAVTESQSAVIKSSKNIHRLHEVALGYQRVALDSLLNLCRLYEAKIESQRAEMELFL